MLRIVYSLLLLLVVFVVFLALPLLFAPADAAAYTDCTGGVLNLRSVAFASSTFSLPDGCALTIDGGTATDLTFTTAHTDLVLVVKNLDCGTGINTPGNCIKFSQSLTGGSINVDGLTRTLSGAVSTGEYNAMRFDGDLSGVAVTLRNVKMTLPSVTCSGWIHVYAILALADVVGGDFNVSGGGVFGSATVATGSEASAVRLVAVANVRVFTNGLTCEVNWSGRQWQ
jgi:hypothetical protein